MESPIILYDTRWRWFYLLDIKYMANAEYKSAKLYNKMKKYLHMSFIFSNFADEFVKNLTYETKDLQSTS